MNLGVIKTDGGAHSPETMAAVAASEIIQVSASASGRQAIEGRRLELKILDILEAGHKEVQSSELAKLAGPGGNDRLGKEYDPTEHGLNETVTAIVEASKGTVFESALTDPVAQERIRAVVGKHYATDMHIQRSLHADKEPHSDHAKAFKARWHGAS